MELWPHQVRAVGGTQAALARGVRRLLVTSPTGTGKTVIMSELIRHWLGEGLRVVLYSNRRWLVQQTSKVLAGAGLAHGVRAAGYADDRELELQVSSVQTEVARVLKAGTWGLHPADRVLVDEAHLQTGAGAQQLLRGHREQGAAVVGLTATPLGLGHLYDELLVAGTASEGRACGALVPALHYGPDEPDVRAAKLGRLAAGADLSENQQRKVMGGVEGGRADERLCRLFGRVLDWFKVLNPGNRPSLLFAPGVAESIWFAEQFSEAGIAAAHVDGNSIWLDGRLERSTAKRREQILEMSQDGTITVLCNRFVLREGIDAPWLAHGVLATVFGSLQSYLQSGGRLLRNHPSLDSVCVQDHGGCLDSETEILTARGWVDCNTISDDDTVAAFDRYSGSITWQPILHRHDRHLEEGEEMYEASGRQCDIRVTGNHNIVFNKRTSTADNRPVWPDSFDLQRADELARSRARFKVPVSGVQAASGLRLSDDQIRFIGWFLTDGTMDRRRAVSITQADHQPQIEDLRACLAGCGFSVRECKRQPTDFHSGPQTQFCIPKGTGRGKKKRNGWWPLRHYLDKDLAHCLQVIDERQFEILLHAIHLGDGDKAKGEDSYRISTGNKTFADRLQSLCVRRGFKCNLAVDRSAGRLNPLYVLNIQKAATLSLHGEAGADGQTRLEVSDSRPGVTRVWCVANPLGTLVTRRNGKVAIVGNSWWRHGSLNADRHWELDYTGSVVAGLREDALREPGQAQPVRCPRCGMVRQWRGPCCPTCGYEMPRSAVSRPVVQSDGTLKEVRGDVFKPRRITKRPDGPALWQRMVYRSRTAKGERTFKAAAALFAVENHGWPDPAWPLMPREARDWYRLVKDVPAERLTPKGS